MAMIPIKGKATPGKVGIEGLREMISNQKKEVIVRFEKYHKALYEWMLSCRRGRLRREV